MELLRSAPQESSFTPVAEYRSQTPASFDSETPVLYHKATGTLLVLKDEASRHPAIETLLKESTPSQDSLLLPHLEAWISSDKLILWHPPSSIGIAIPYPSISLHAIGSIPSPEVPEQKTQALYLEINVGNGFDDHDQEGSVVLNFLHDLSSSAQELFEAVTDCANLHPDPVSAGSSEGGEDDEGDDVPVYDYQVLDGQEGMPPPLPGSSGWITADNVGEYFDEDGNWRGGGLGPGAGIVREREDDGENGINGTHSTNGDETKWRRTED